MPPQRDDRQRDGSGWVEEAIQSSVGNQKMVSTMIKSLITEKSDYHPFTANAKTAAR
jgi:hypothetical protein